jgi:hypothetical protein
MVSKAFTDSLEDEMNDIQPDWHDSPVKPDPCSWTWTPPQPRVENTAAEEPAQPPESVLTARQLEHLRWLQEVHGTAYVRENYEPWVVEQFLASNYNLYPDREPDATDALRRELIESEQAGATVEILRLRKELLTMVEVPARELRLETHDPVCSCDDCVYARSQGFAQIDHVWTKVTEPVKVELPVELPMPPLPPHVAEQPHCDCTPCKSARQVLSAAGFYWHPEEKAWLRLARAK